MKDKQTRNRCTAAKEAFKGFPNVGNTILMRSTKLPEFANGQNKKFKKTYKITKIQIINETSAIIDAEVQHRIQTGGTKFVEFQKVYNNHVLTKDAFDAGDWSYTKQRKRAENPSRREATSDESDKDNDSVDGDEERDGDREEAWAREEDGDMMVTLIEDDDRMVTEDIDEAEDEEMVFEEDDVDVVENNNVQPRVSTRGQKHNAYLKEAVTRAELFECNKRIMKVEASISQLSDRLTTAIDKLQKDITNMYESVARAQNNDDALPEVPGVLSEIQKMEIYRRFTNTDLLKHFWGPSDVLSGITGKHIKGPSVLNGTGARCANYKNILLKDADTCRVMPDGDSNAKYDAKLAEFVHRKLFGAQKIRSLDKDAVLAELKKYALCGKCCKRSGVNSDDFINILKRTTMCVACLVSCTETTATSTSGSFVLCPECNLNACNASRGETFSGFAARCLKTIGDIFYGIKDYSVRRQVRNTMNDYVADIVVTGVYNGRQFLIVIEIDGKEHITMAKKTTGKGKNKQELPTPEADYTKMIAQTKALFGENMYRNVLMLRLGMQRELLMQAHGQEKPHYHPFSRVDKVLCMRQWIIWFIKNMHTFNPFVIMYGFYPHEILNSVPSKKNLYPYQIDFYGPPGGANHNDWEFALTIHEKEQGGHLYKPNYPPTNLSARTQMERDSSGIVRCPPMWSDTHLFGMYSHA